MIREAFSVAVLAAACIAVRWFNAPASALGWTDRIGGGALGGAEGALIAAILVIGVFYVLGRNHPGLEKPLSIEAVEVLQTYVTEDVEGLPAVGSPPRS